MQDDSQTLIESLELSTGGPWRTASHATQVQKGVFFNHLRRKKKKNLRGVAPTSLALCLSTLIPFKSGTKLGGLILN